MKKNKAIVLLSGGLDSAVCLWWAKKNNFNCTALSFDYGQRHKKELGCATRLARRARIPQQVVSFKLPWSRSSLTKKSAHLPTKRSDRQMAARIPSTYVPGRNTLFLSFALSLADQIKARAIVIGANAIDYSGYPDCRPKFIRSFEAVARQGSKLGAEGKSIAVLAPLVRKSKEEIVKMAKRLGVPVDLTWSCYQGGRSPCGRCDSCILRQKGFSKANRQ